MGVKPNGGVKVRRVSKTLRISADRFDRAVVRAIDQHAAAIAELSHQVAATRSFVADLSLRLDALTTHAAPNEDT